MNKIRKLSLTVILPMLIVIVWATTPVSAQAPVEIACGQSIESLFTENGQSHRYVADIRAGTRIVIYAERNIGNYETLRIDTGLWAPNGFEIDELDFYDRDATRTIETGELSTDGRYEIAVQGWTDTGGAYSISLSCIDSNGEVITANNLIQMAQCGSIIENTIGRDGETHRYYIVLTEGDSIQANVASLAGNYETLSIDTGLWAPNGFEINELDFYDREATRNITTNALSTSGIYRFLVRGWTSTSGRYELSVTCTLADGTVVNPGDTPPISLVSGNSAIETADVEFSGFGFPGLAPVDFTNVARLPIPAGVPMSGAVTPTGGEILGYQFDASEGDTVELSFNRLSGNLNLGLVVIDENSNVVYQSSLVTAESMTARFSIPTSGQYTAGIFRISLLPPSSPEPTAFQVIATVNP